LDDMKTLIAIVTGLHVLAHGVFGCCDHGALATAGALPCVCEHVHQHADEASNHHAGEHVDRHAPSDAPHECVHASCHWVAGGVGPSVTPLDFSLPATFVAVTPTSVSAMHAAAFEPDDVRGRTSTPPLRLHLALGVLVV
jgi:hypothetical protein